MTDIKWTVAKDRTTATAHLAVEHVRALAKGADVLGELATFAPAHVRNLATCVSDLAARIVETTKGTKTHYTLPFEIGGDDGDDGDN